MCSITSLFVIFPFTSISFIQSTCYTIPLFSLFEKKKKNNQKYRTENILSPLFYLIFFSFAQCLCVVDISLFPTAISNFSIKSYNISPNRIRA